MHYHSVWITKNALFILNLGHNVRPALHFLLYTLIISDLKVLSISVLLSNILWKEGWGTFNFSFLFFLSLSVNLILRKDMYQDRTGTARHLTPICKADVIMTSFYVTMVHDLEESEWIVWGQPDGWPLWISRQTVSSQSEGTRCPRNKSYQSDSSPNITSKLIYICNI